jgi:hypothetical protein
MDALVRLNRVKSLAVRGSLTVLVASLELGVEKPDLFVIGSVVQLVIKTQKSSDSVLFLDFVELGLRYLVYFSQKFQGLFAAPNFSQRLLFEGSSLFVASLGNFRHTIGLKILPIPLDIGQSSNFFLMQLNLSNRVVYLSLDILRQHHSVAFIDEKLLHTFVLGLKHLS